MTTVSRGAIWVGGMLLAVGCTFGGSAASTGVDSIGGGSTGAATGGGGSGPGVSTGPDSDAGSESPGPVSETGSPDTGDGNPEDTADNPADTDTGDGSTGEPASALLQFDGPESFGPTGFRVAVREVMTVTNIGVLAATEIIEAKLPATFSYTGGAFPGEGGSCKMTLEPDESCQIELEFSAEMLGALDFVLALEYDNGLGPAAAEVAVDALVEGSTDNLIANPSFEQMPMKDDPVPQWSIHPTVMTASWDPQGAPDGNRYLYGGQGAFGPAVHHAWQEFDVSTWATSIDAGEVEVELAGQLWSAYNDVGQLHVGFVPEAGKPTLLSSPQVGPGYEGNWVEYTSPATAIPVGTRLLRIEAACTKPQGEWCDATFDALSLVATYTGA